MPEQLQLRLDGESNKTISSMLEFLTLNHYNPAISYLSNEAFIEEGVIYNSSFSRLVLAVNLNNCEGESLEFEGTFCDDDTTFRVYKIKAEYREEVYSFVSYFDDSFPSKRVKIFKRGDWEKALIEEYQRRKVN